MTKGKLKYNRKGRSSAYPRAWPTAVILLPRLPVDYVPAIRCFRRLHGHRAEARGKSMVGLMKRRLTFQPHVQHDASRINIELGSPEDFIPVREDWPDRSPFRCARHESQGNPCERPLGGPGK
jgi:hypothetical protein